MKLISPPDISETIALLHSANLPTADVTPELIENFAGITAEGKLIGVIGYEGFGRTGLLRSLVVAPAARGHGLAVMLVHRIEEIARKNGAEALYLLTTDADQYFSRHGFEALPRDEVPTAIQSTAQFSSLCPGSAVVMVKSL